MYCGDETGAFVGDLGHTTSRFGYGGEDCPKSVVPSWTLAGGGDGGNNSVTTGNKRQHKHASCPGSTLRVPPSLVANEDDAGDIVPIFDWSKSGSSCHPDDYLGSSGVVANWDAYEAAWSDAFSTLRVWDGRKHTTGSGGGGGGDAEEERKCIHPLLAVDAGHTCYGRHEVKNRDKDADAGDSSGAAIEAAGPADPDERLRLQQRSKMMELLFEKFDAPAVFIAPSPMLAAFAHGRQTGLVVDVGGSGTRVTPIIDGLVLRSAQRRSGRGGEWLGAVQERALTEFCGAKDVVPHYALGPPPSAGASGVGSSRRRTVKYRPGHALRKTIFHQVAMADYMYEMLTGSHVTLQPWRQDLTVPFVGYEGDSKKRKRGGGGGGDDDEDGDVSGSDDGDGPSDDDKAMEEDNAEAGEEEVEGTSYTLPDGTRVDLAMSKPGKDLCRLPELLYTDEVPFGTLDQQNALSTFKSGQSIAESTLSSLPIHRLAHASLTAVGDGDARKELCGNILLTGGASLFPNMEARLSYEMSNTAPSAYKCKVVASRNTVERRYAPWIGGSILTSLGSFQQLWLSRAEYEEYGATLGSDRFP